ncbi:hypothetical protein EW146_g9370 [Bondarzewia mesenterica]|uniref:Uncharacterized protein n=1 Tax=Bondarzewia mesenterica TaxID=1095465 RepID=A0A4V3XCV0_9AGAM|nr:hypothetical protein EW146_g9370 [Bondarzewia mesenterica]
MTTATTHAPGGYSSIFSSGLLATPRPHGRMDSPNSRPTSPTTSPMITDLESTPTGLKQSFSEYPPSTSPPSHFLDTDNGSSRSRASSTSSFTAPQAPKLRRRKSSITVGSSAMGSIKSPLRSAGAALQRTVLMSPTSGSRSRSGSLSVDAGPELQLGSAPRTGRMRSGSLGDVLRSRRAIRKPPTAPPSMPLPPPPVPILSQASAATSPSDGKVGADEREVALCVLMLSDGRVDVDVDEVLDPSFDGATVWRDSPAAWPAIEPNSPADMLRCRRARAVGRVDKEITEPEFDGWTLDTEGLAVITVVADIFTVVHAICGSWGGLAYDSYDARPRPLLSLPSRRRRACGVLIHRRRNASHAPPSELHGQTNTVIAIDVYFCLLAPALHPLRQSPQAPLAFLLIQFHSDQAVPDPALQALSLGLHLVFPPRRPLHYPPDRLLPLAHQGQGKRRHVALLAQHTPSSASTSKERVEMAQGKERERSCNWHSEVDIEDMQHRAAQLLAFHEAFVDQLRTVLIPVRFPVVEKEFMGRERTSWDTGLGVGHGEGIDVLEQAIIEVTMLFTTQVALFNVYEGFCSDHFAKLDLVCRIDIRQNGTCTSGVGDAGAGVCEKSGRAGAVKAKYRAVFLYTGGNLMLAKVGKGRYAPRHWFPLMEFTVVDSLEDKVRTLSDVSPHSIHRIDAAHAGIFHPSARTGASSVMDDGDMRENERSEAMENEDAEIDLEENEDAVEIEDTEFEGTEIEGTEVKGTEIEEIEDGEVLEQAA